MTNELITRPGSIESSKKALTSNFEAVVSDARASLHDAQTALTGKARCASNFTQQYVSANPWKSLGIIGALGLIIGALSSRR